MTGRLRTLSGSYRARLALGYALVVVVLAGLWAWSLYGPLTQIIVEQQRTHLRTIAQASALGIAGYSASPASQVRALVAGTDLRITVVRADGTVLADSGADAGRMDNHRDRPEIRTALAGLTGYDTRRSVTLGVEQLYVAVPATVDGGRGAVRVSEPLAAVDQLAERARQTGLLLLLGGLAAAVIVGLRLSASAAEPVLRLKRAAEIMAAGNLTTPVPEATGEIGELAGALSTLRDGMRSTIGELRSGQATLRAVLDGLEQAIFLFEGDRISLANRAAGVMFRAPSGGWADTRLAAAPLPASLAAHIAPRLADGAPSRADVGPDPEQRYLRVTTVPLNPTDAGSRTLVAVEDVTEQRRLDRVRRDFVANASHELKTPASAIQLLADSADTAASDGDTRQALVFVSQMKEEADRLRRLVLDLLDLSRIESAPASGTITDARAAARNALAAHRAAAAGAGLSLSFDDTAVPGEDVYAASEPSDLAVALDNLLANAISYTEDGGVTLGLAADDSVVVLTVSDTGIGIPPEHLPRIFERFYRVDPSRTRASGGTGLGLALVRNAAERAGGTVEIASTPGEGTTVVLRLPRAR